MYGNFPKDIYICKKYFAMSERRKIFIDAKKTQIDYYNTLSNWCGDNGLFVRTNHEVFFINERVLMKPEYIINETVFIDLVDEGQITDKYLGYCELFSKSYGTIIVISREKLDDVKTITKKDIESRFNIKF
jgi:hypothetical protein